MKNWIQYGLVNAAVGFLVGGAIAAVAIGNGYSIFTVAAPTTAFLIRAFFWK